MKRRSPLPELRLDRSSRESLHEQLARALRDAMDSGALAPGAALPSSRALAATLGLSRNTVVTAYEELAAEGRIAGRAGSATRVVAACATPRIPDWQSIVRSSQYPVNPVRFVDSDGNGLYFHR